MFRWIFGWWLLLASCNAGGQQLESAVFNGTTTAGQLSNFSNAAQYDVDHYKIRYYTTDVNGSQTVASGALMIPHQATCDSFALVVYEHATVLEKSNVPSHDNLEGVVPKVFASTGAVAVAPDYLGLGDNGGLHPFMHAKTEATASLDLVRAAREFLTDSLPVELNTEVFVTGYSQGGHAAMAMAEYVQDQNLLNEFNIIGAGPASGPYNLSGTQEEILTSVLPYSHPGYVVYLMLGMNRVYSNIFQQYSDILKPPYDTLIPPYFDGTHDMQTVHSLLPDTISGFIQDSVLTNFANDSVNKTHPIWQALLANDNYDWNPSFPMELYYCTADEEVDPQNAFDAETAMRARGANVNAVFKGHLDHDACFLPAMEAALDYFISLRTGCEAVGFGEDIATSTGAEIYPNPACSEVSIKGLEEEMHLKIFDLSGRMVFQNRVKDAETIDTRSWARGTYLVNLSGEGGSTYRKLVLTD